MGSGFWQADRCPGGRRRRRGSPDTVDLVPLKAREGSCGGMGEELKYRAIRLWKLRWNFGTSGGWGSKGLIKVVGFTVGTGHGESLHWSSKAVRVVLERRRDWL